MINVLYFAKTREIIGKMSDSVSLEQLGQRYSRKCA